MVPIILSFLFLLGGAIVQNKHSLCLKKKKKRAELFLQEFGGISYKNKRFYSFKYKRIYMMQI